MTLTFNSRPVISDSFNTTKVNLYPSSNQINQNNNTLVDSSGNNIQVTSLNSPGQGPFSPEYKNWSVYFSDSASKVSVPNYTDVNIGTVDFTIEFWIQPTLSGSTMVLMDTRGTTTNSGWSIIISSTAITLQYNSINLISVSFPDALAMQQVWNHIAFSRSNGVVRSYLNGRKNNEVNSTASLTALSFVIGYRNYSSISTIGFKGYISNLRIIVGTGIYNSAMFDLPRGNLTSYPGTVVLLFQSNTLLNQAKGYLSSYSTTTTGTPTISRRSPFNVEYNHRDYNNSLVSDPSPFNTNVSWLFNNGSVTVQNASNMRLESSTSLPDWTFECYVYVISYPAKSQRLAGTMPSAGNTGWAINLTTSRKIEYRHSISSVYTSTLTIEPGNWVHLAIVKTASTNLKMYIDGTIAGNFTITSGSNSTMEPIIGNSQTDNPFNGYISNLRISNVSTIYRNEFIPKKQHLDSNADAAYMLAQLPFASSTGTDPHDLVFSSGVTLSAAGPFKSQNDYSEITTGSMFFDGSDSLSTGFESVFNFGANDFTIEMWIYCTSSVASETTLFNFLRSGVSYGITLGFTSSGSLFLRNTETPATSTLSSVGVSTVMNKWAHLALVRRNTGYQVYFNSNRVLSVGSGLADVSNVKLIMGTNFIGYMSNVRVLNGTAAYDADSLTYTTDNSNETTIVKKIPNTVLLLNFNDYKIRDSVIDSYNVRTHNVTVTDTVTYNNKPTYYFSGNGYLELSDDPNIRENYQGFKVYIWVRPTLQSSSVFIGSTTSSMWYLGMGPTGYLTARIGSYTISYTAKVIPLNTWTLLGLSLDSSSSNVIFNDTVVGSSSAFDTLPSLSSKALITVGASNARSSFFTGYIGPISITRS